MTTDTRPKEAALRLNTPDGPLYVGGMAKGAGMIHPDMATMLALVTTDAWVEPGLLQEVLVSAVARSFNRISVDGDTSTNDTVLLLANGASGVKVSDAGSLEAFEAGVTQVCIDLAQQIVRDGEGASRFVTITVQGAGSDEDAHQIANTIATSPLVKTAIAGGDANCGRILAAAGRAGVPFAQDQVQLCIGQPGVAALQLVAGGEPTDYAEPQAAAIFAGDEIVITLQIGAGAGEATVWTCDLTRDYVSINADYRS
jgi:glutamate N-acetyltransferase/amino-acid N-acetyltransferase